MDLNLGNPISMGKYIFNFQGFDLTQGVTITSVSYNGTTTSVSPNQTFYDVNGLTEFLVKMQLADSCVEAPANGVIFHSSLDFVDQYYADPTKSTTNALYFTFMSVAYVLKADGKRARTLSSYNSTPFPSYTVPVVVAKSSDFMCGMIRLSVDGNVQFFGDIVAFCVKYNRTYTIDGSGNVTVTLSNGSTTIVNPFNTLSATVQLFNDIEQLGQWGVASAVNTWTVTNGLLTMTLANDQNMLVSIQCNINNLA